MALETVAKCIAEARVLLQDISAPYRYPDADLLVGLNAALMEARRLRPDLFLTTSGVAPNYTSAADTTDLGIDQQYRMTIVYYIVANAHLRDEEDASDARATALFQRFNVQLTGIN